MAGGEIVKKMAYQTIQEFNATGLDNIVVYVANTVPIFIPALLIIIWISVTLMIYYGTRKFGTGDFFVAAAASGFLAFVIGTIMTLTFGIINNWTLGTLAGILIISVLSAFVKRNRD